MAQESRKSELIAQLALARSDAASNVAHLRRDLDFGRRLKASFQQHQLAWLAGCGALGFVITRLGARRQKVIVERPSRKAGAEKKVVEAGVFVTLLKFAFDLARPVLTRWLTRQVTAYAAQRFGEKQRD
jgi:hypothetical protein